MNENLIQKDLSILAALTEVDLTRREKLIAKGIDLSGSDIDSAVKCFTAAAEIKEDYLLFYNIGCLYYKKNDYKKGVINLEKSRKLNPGFFMSSLITGLCYSRLQNIKAARSNFINVLMHDPDNRIAATALSIMLQNQGKISESVKILNRLSGSSEKTAADIKEIKKESEAYRSYDDYINSVPVDIYNDKYGTMSEKITTLETNKTQKNLISLSLCHLLKGDTDSAIDFLLQARETL